jgi:hypothetical protein
MNRYTINALAKAAPRTGPLQGAPWSGGDFGSRRNGAVYAGQVIQDDYGTRTQVVRLEEHDAHGAALVASYPPGAKNQGDGHFPRIDEEPFDAACWCERTTVKIMSADVGVRTYSCGAPDCGPGMEARCKHCGTQLVKGRHKATRYCSPQCQQRWGARKAHVRQQVAYEAKRNARIKRKKVETLRDLEDQVLSLDEQIRQLQMEVFRDIISAEGEQ